MHIDNCRPSEMRCSKFSFCDCIIQSLSQVSLREQVEDLQKKLEHEEMRRKIENEQWMYTNFLHICMLYAL